MCFILDIELALSLCAPQCWSWKNGHIHCARQYAAANSMMKEPSMYLAFKTHSFTKKLLWCKLRYDKKDNLIYLRIGNVPKCWI